MKIWGHRGAPCCAPENTLYSFKEAIALKADGVEFDVQLTKDGEVVVAHDETLERVSDGGGMLKDYTLQELRRFNFNKRGISEPKFMQIPTLNEVLALLKPTNLLLNIELKTGIVFYNGLERKTYDAVKKFDMAGRVLYSSFNHYSLQKIKEIDPTAQTALLCGGEVFATGEQCAKVGASALHPSALQMRYPGLIEECHRYGVKVNVWTVETEDDFTFAKTHGVDGVFVNDLVKFR